MLFTERSIGQLSVNEKQQLAYLFLQQLHLPKAAVADLVHQFQAKNLQNVPVEVWLEIFSALGVDDVVNCALVNRPLYAIASSNAVWRQLFQQNAHAWRFAPLIRRCSDWKSAFRVAVELNRNWTTGRCVKKTFSCKSLSDSHSDTIYALVCEPRHGVLISVSRDHTVKLWDIFSHSCIDTWRFHRGSVLCLATDMARGIVVTGSSDATVGVWDYSSKTLVAALRGHSDSVFNIQVYKNRIVSCSKDGTVKIWDVATFKLVSTLSAHLSAVNCVQVANDRIVSASSDRTIRVWDLNDGTGLHVFEGFHMRAIVSLAFDGRTIVSGSSDYTLQVFDATTFKWVRSIYNAHQDLIRSIVLNGDVMASGSYDGTIKLWERRSYNDLLDYEDEYKTLLCRDGHGRLGVKSMDGFRVSVGFSNPQLHPSQQQRWRGLYEIHKADWSDCGQVYSIAFNSRYLFTCGPGSEITCLDFGHGIDGIDSLACDW
ncbi:hypothetical protein TRVA0_001S06678 [Trichomonascus vanleenenianus]|uniref:F-box/WD repeat-containing protein n=1 Tax=Trichomonascus vanleenenianus TaxID=2268995 RepID=UPI003EC97919